MSDDIRKMVTDALGDPASLGMLHNAPYLLAVEHLVAAITAYGQSRANEATERAARVCDEAAAQAENRSKDPHEWSSVKLSAGSVAWSLRHAATAIRSQK